MNRTTKRILSATICIASILLSFFFTLSSGVFDRILLADEEKTQITNEMLASSYEQHYTTEGKTSMIFMIAFGVAIIAIIIGLIVTLKKLRDSQEENKGAKMLIAGIVAIPAIGIFGVIMLMSSCGLLTNPSPDKASYHLECITVIKTEMETRTDSDGDRHYSYYAYVVDDRRESGERKTTLTQSEYNAITGPGDYYFAFASSGKINYRYDIYSAEIYEPAPDVEVE